MLQKLVWVALATSNLLRFACSGVAWYGVILCRKQQSFDYTVICQQPGVGDDGRGTPSAHHSPAQAPRTRPWHDFGRQNDADKIQIPKL